MDIETNLEEMKEFCGYDQSTGTSMWGLVNAAKRKGLAVSAVKISAEELGQMQSPAIAYLWGSHFVVVEPGDSGKLVITDPPTGSQCVGVEDFKDTYSGFALLIAKHVSALPQQSPEGPDLRFTGYVWDFGSTYPGGILDHSFKCRNVGNADLVISNVESSCSCFVPLTTTVRIPPGGMGEIKVALDTSGELGHMAKELYITSNDSISPVVRLDAFGYLKSPGLRVSPPMIDFGASRRAQGASEQVYIPSTLQDPIEVKRVNCDLPFVTASMSDSQTNGLPGTVVSLALKSDAPLGEFEGKLIIETDHPKEPRAGIPIMGNVKGDIAVDGESFFLGMVKKGASAESTLTLSTSSADRVEIKKIDCPLGCVALNMIPKTEGKEYVLTATLSADAPVGYIKDEVTIHTNNPDQPEIKVPLYALVTD